MSNAVIIKSNPYGIQVILDASMDFEDLRKEIINKFKSSEKFFLGSALGIAFDGRDLTDEQQLRIVNDITENTSINIVCLVDSDIERANRFREAIAQNTMDNTDNDGFFYKGTLRSGQVLESEKSIIIIGDVNPGAKVISKGNIIVIGALKGTVYAGASENHDAFVIALQMEPVQIKIGELIARSSDKATEFIPKKKKKKELPTFAMVAYAKDDKIVIESLSKEI